MNGFNRECAGTRFRTACAGCAGRITRRMFLAAGVASTLRAAANSFNPGFASAKETAEAIRLRKISASELLNATFKRIDLYNPKLNAIIIEFREKATARARQADQALAHGRLWGPLHGVPVTIKEAFAYRDSPNTWGLARFKDVKGLRNINFSQVVGFIS